MRVIDVVQSNSDVVQQFVTGCVAAAVGMLAAMVLIYIINRVIDMGGK